VTSDERFMASAIELARRASFTSPNPRVGCVVVRDDAVIGEGWHEGAGLPHAEPQALAGIDARGATLYVTLEPCIHQGRTPPCVPTVLGAGIERVVAATADPDELVAGKGFAALAAAGVEVEIGVLAAEAEALNEAYLHHRRTGTPFVSLKLALSLDGGLAAPDGSARWITGSEARRVVHRRRHEVDAVMVGAGTVVADDPSLTVRDVPAKRQPARIIVDGSGRVDPGARIFNPDAPVMVATTTSSSEEHRDGWRRTGAEVIVVPASGSGVGLPGLMKELGARDIVEILCEGGSELATSLIREELVQRLELHYGPVLLGSSALRIRDLGVETMGDAGAWRVRSVAGCGSGFIVHAVPAGEDR
jgi:diaminohydroxyphosphoribosylaminopyrimidine deaminase / 5-amino-6-(5-phosphoribosylamino)uracil reductase